MTIEQELVAAFRYNPATGELRWSPDKGPRGRRGVIAGTLNGVTGYLQVSYRGRKYKIHRLAWLLYYGKWPDNTVDHDNQIKTDNRIENLKDVTQAENNKNMRRWREGKLIPRYSESGEVGVHYRKDRHRWRARIKVDSKYVCLGCFSTKEEAVEARVNAERLYR